MVHKHELTIYPSLVLVKPRNTLPGLTERLLMGRKESNQTKINTKKTVVQDIGTSMLVFALNLK